MDSRCGDVQAALRDTPTRGQRAAVTGMALAQASTTLRICALRLCEKQRMLHNLPFLVCAQCSTASHSLILCCFHAGQLQVWGKVGACVMPAQGRKFCWNSLTSASLSFERSVMNDRRAEGTGRTVSLYLLPPSMLLFTLMNRCEQCRSCSSSIKIELKCS